MRTIEDLAGEVERRFTELARGSADGMRIVDLPQETAAGRLLLGLASDGARLLVPFAPNEHRRFKTDRRSSGLQLEVRPLESNGERRYYLDALCPKADLRWLFSSFVADVLLRLGRAPDVDGPAEVRRCVTAWRAMFAREGRRLSLKQLAGLFGELIILGRLQDRSADSAVRWRGPLGEPHDFAAPGVLLEVKSTLSTEDRVVHIHGLQQLAVPSDEELVLTHLRLEAGGAGGESLPALVERSIAVDTSGRLKGLVQAGGYFHEHAESYEDMRFELVDEEWFDVDDGFPRLTAATFPDAQVPIGLGRFSYTLDLSTVVAPPFATDRSNELLDRLAP